MNRLSSDDASRLVACLELWRRPGTPGERDAAMAGAVRILDNRGLSWRDVVAPTRSQDATASEQAHPPSQDWRRTASACSRFPHLLDRWEYEFIIGLLQFPRLSVKQNDCLRKIVVRLRACGCAV
jgi:hypothetical protein